ncbi:hypothetical protein QA597_05035 [Marinilabiliaceae bacterium ANBcel2]|nr:hypothetical protein [Marinilabiliaceae bacterium ANBcel2]
MSTTGQPDSVMPAPLIERITAAIIDIIIVIGLCFFPRIGWMFGIIYHLTKDSLPLLKGQSLGKQLLNIRTLAMPQKVPLSVYPEKSVIRGLVMLIPILNIIDAWFLLSKGYRLADKWAQTTVVFVHDDESEL